MMYSNLCLSFRWTLPLSQTTNGSGTLLSQLFHIWALLYCLVRYHKSFPFWSRNFQCRRDNLSNTNLKFDNCRHQGLRGATVARLTPDQKVACSNHVEVNYFRRREKRKFFTIKLGVLIFSSKCSVGATYPEKDFNFSKRRTSKTVWRFFYEWDKR